MKAVSDSSARMKQSTWRGKASYTEWACGLKCSFRCLSQSCVSKGSNSREFETWFALAEQLDCAWLNLGRILLWTVWGGGRTESEPSPQSREWEQEGERDPCSADGDICPPCASTAQWAAGSILLNSALPLHSLQVLSQTSFRTLCLRWEGSQAALRSRKVPTRLPGTRV